MVGQSVCSSTMNLFPMIPITAMAQRGVEVKGGRKPSMALLLAIKTSPC